MSQGLELDLVIGNSLITLHGKCGSSGDAQTVFNLMPERDTISWTAMIAAYAQHGESERARQLFYQMKNQAIFPNKITFLSIISACGHAGEIEEGYYWFVSMDRRYGLTPTMDHYNCMIDLLGRAGRLDEAENVMMSMPSSDITIVSLMALLSSCKYQTDVERGERLSKRAFMLFPECPEPYIMLANIYSSAGSVRDAEILMAMMRNKGLEEQIEL
jgi:pentatricopeptide repeat protein